MKTLEETFSEEGRRRVGQDTGPGMEIGKAIAELERLKADIKAEMGSGDTEAQGSTPSVPLAVQLAIVDSLLIMFESPTEADDIVARAEKMEKTTEAIASLREDEMTAAIDYMESIYGGHTFSAAVYQYMRRHFCVSNEADIVALDAKEDPGTPPGKWKSLALHDPDICSGTTCTLCSEAIKTQEKCGFCGRLVCRPCTWRSFFGTSVTKLFHYNLDEMLEDHPHIEFVIKMVAFFKSQVSDAVDEGRKEIIQENFYDAMWDLRDAVIFQCSYCRSPLYLHGEIIASIEKLVDEFRGTYRQILSILDTLDEVTRNRVGELKDGFNTSVRALKRAHESFEEIQDIQGEAAQTIAYDKLRPEYATLDNDLRYYYNALLFILVKNFHGNLVEMTDSTLEEIDPAVWKARFPSFYGFEYVTEFLTNPVSDWRDDEVDPPQTFSSVFSTNIEKYLRDPENYEFRGYEYYLALRERTEVHRLADDEDDRDARPLDFRRLAYIATFRINEEVGGREQGRHRDIDREQFAIFTAKTRNFWNLGQDAIESARTKLVKALTSDYSLERDALTKWAAYYGGDLVAYINDTRTTLIELFNAPDTVPVAELLAKITEVEFFVDTDLDSGHRLNTSNIGNQMIIPKYKYLRVAGDDSVSVVPGPRQSSEALTEYVLKRALLGKCENLGSDPDVLFHALTSGDLNLTDEEVIDRLVTEFNPRMRNIWQIDAVLDIAILLRVVEEPVGTDAPDLQQRLLHALNVTTKTYTDSCNVFYAYSYVAPVSYPEYDLIWETFHAIDEELKARARHDTNKKSSLVFELALAIIWMRANCSGRNVSFYRLEKELALAGGGGPLQYPSNHEAQDEFLIACNHLRYYLDTTNWVEGEAASLHDTRSNPAPGSLSVVGRAMALPVARRAVRPARATVRHVPRPALLPVPRSPVRRVPRLPASAVAASAVRPVARRQTRRAFPVSVVNLDFPGGYGNRTNSRPLPTPPPVWRGGDTVVGALFPTPLSGGEGAEKGGASGISSAAAIFLSLAVVAASALAGAIESAA